MTTAHPPAPTTETFGRLLRHWRSVRRQSQLALSSVSGISTRHLSFLETDRSRPSRDMVARLGEVLALPLAERNALHVAAGFAPPFSARPLDDEGVQHVRAAIDYLMTQHLPHPAIAIDEGWDVVLHNAAVTDIFGPFMAAYDMPEAIRGNALHVVFHPGGLRPFVLNWEEFAVALLRIVHRDALAGSREGARLLDEIMAYAGLPGLWQRAASLPVTAPVTPLRLATGERPLAFFTTFTTLAMPADVVLETLRIEAFHPADETTAAYVRGLRPTDER